MSKYQNSKIYKIYSDLGDKIYIGCTTKQYLSQRMARHKYDYTYFKKKREETGFAFVTSYLLFDEYGVDNCKIELLETYPCNSIDEIRKQEAHYIKTIPNINNYHNWTPQRIEETREKGKDKYQEQKEKIKEKYQSHKEKIKEKYQDHRNELLEKAKLYRESHRDELKAKARARYQLKKEKRIEVVKDTNE
jgi:hypothetical protein